MGHTPNLRSVNPKTNSRQRKGSCAMAFKGCPPGKAVMGHPKIMVSGKSGDGKTWFATSLPKVFYIDTEAGADLPHYQQRLKDAGAWYMGPDHGALDFDEVIKTVRELATQKHEYKTLVIDSFSKLYNTAAGLAEEKLGNEFGRDKKEANKPTRSLVRWIDKLDMNVVLVCHQRAMWANGASAGTTFDGWDKLEYELHLWLEVQRRGKDRVGLIRKSRLTGFAQDTSIPLTYEAFAERYGKDYIEAEAKAIVMASPLQVSEIKDLINILRVDEDTTGKWLAKAGADRFEDMIADDVSKCIAHLQAKMVRNPVAA